MSFIHLGAALHQCYLDRDNFAAKVEQTSETTIGYEEQHRKINVD